MIRRSLTGASLAVLAAAAAFSAPAHARDSGPLSIRNSFRIGNAGVLCTAQNAPLDKRLVTMFDRGYRISCRDAAGVVGTMIAVRNPVDIDTAPSAMPGADYTCSASSVDKIDNLGGVSAATCRDPKSKLDYKRYLVRRGGVTYLVEGLAGYDPALRLALASVVKDRAIPGTIRVATTEVTDPAAFARVQAGQLDKVDIRDEGYQRNNGGSFAESSEFFETLASRQRGDSRTAAEAIANQGLQQSNLGNFSGAERLFQSATEVLARNDGVTQRLIRNYRAINALNQRDPDGARKALAAPVIPVNADFDENGLKDGYINTPLSDQINRENVSLQRIGGVDTGLTRVERAVILDAQGLSLAATADRMEGKDAAATDKFNKAEAQIDSVRDGRVVSVNWLRSEISMELALIAEKQGHAGEAESDYDNAISLIGEAYPQSPALLAAQARKAAFLGRTGKTDQAKALYASVVAASADVTDSGPALRQLLAPYFDLLAANPDQASAGAMFEASQVLQRPGVAQTQAILAREFSQGNDEAASLFRLSLVRSREIARTEGEVSQISAIENPTSQDLDNLRSAQETLASLKQDQTALVAKLAAYPRYKVLAPQRVALSDLQKSLYAGEAYYKMMAVGDKLYTLFITPDSAKLFKIPLTREELAKQVQTIRDSVVTVENGQQVNYPFDLDSSRALYHSLFDPIGGDVPAIRHLIFEPDAAMLQLPPSVLVTTDRGIAHYKEESAKPDGDPFNFTGIDWLARGREISIAVSPRGFMDIRKLGRSSAPRNYLGLGHNAVPAFRPVAAVATECEWPLALWQHPISANELYFAEKKLTKGLSEVRTDAQFSDTELDGDKQLDQYRILHFATHGLVTAPRPDCPARPALVTSFGKGKSDGLLSFKEVFDLKLDADLVILSACDTAGQASVAASREAGVTTGGNYALDGLVRAFVGAGARTVVASHWPVPDDFNATTRLIGGLIDAKPGEPLAKALENAEEKLMDDPNTSHPFYWAAFIILGDGAKPLIDAQGMASAKQGHTATQLAAKGPQRRSTSVLSQ
ncbi:CHAT domain-containing protein [Novosphingobium sp. ZN18A2]|uniref:CHAT domain-containing protein n=1 Tax=Novosphingobium sp. ZN18A2 TaxID=3079861 RepID=UPI0030D13469